MTEYFVTYNAKKFEYVVWNNQQVILRVHDNREPASQAKVVEFLEEEYRKAKEPIQIFEIPSATGSLEAIMKAVEGIRKK